MQEQPSNHFIKTSPGGGALHYTLATVHVHVATKVPARPPAPSPPCLSTVGSVAVDVRLGATDDAK